MTMRNVLIFWIGTIIAGSLLTGCKKDEPPTVDLGYGYFPNKVGAWIEYQVDSLWRDDVAAVRDSVSYRLMEKVVEAYTDPAGRPAWRIHRFVLDADSNWVVRDVWTRTKDEIAAEVTEENLRRQKLSFPVREGRSWDLNVYNVEGKLEVAFREVGLPWSGGGLSFSDAVLVKNAIPANFVETNNYEERWARDLGMVSLYREVKNQQTAGCLGCWRLDMVAVAYGTE